MWYWYLLVEVFAGGRQTRQLLVQHVLLGTHAVTLHVLGPVQLPHVKVKHLQKDQSQFQTHRTRTRIEEHKTEHSSVSGRPAAGPASITFLSSLLIWDSSMVTFSVFHTHEWLVKYSRTIMALWRREMVFIILGGRGSVGRTLGRRLGRRSKKDQSGGQNQEAPSSGSLSSCPHTQSGVNPINEPQPQKNQNFRREWQKTRNKNNSTRNCICQLHPPGNILSPQTVTTVEDSMGHFGLLIGPEPPERKSSHPRWNHLQNLHDRISN